MEIDFLGNFAEKLAEYLDLNEAWVVIALIALYLYKKYVEGREERHKRRTETLAKLVAHLEEGSNDRFVTEMLFANHFTKQISWHEISFFLSLHSPSDFLHRFLSSRQYLAVSNDGRTLKYKNDKHPRIAKW